MTKKGLIVLPTGKGKSIIGLYLAAYFLEKTLIIVHKDDLVVGWKKDIELCFGSKIESGLIKAKSRKVGEQITIATIQTLNRLDDNTVEELSNTFGMVIVDEAHHCPASSYDFLMRLKPKYRLGLTATPERADGLKQLLSLHFGGIAYKYVKSKDEEDILPVEVISKVLPLYVDPLCVKINSKKYILSPKYQLWKNPNYALSKNQIRFSSIKYDARPKLILSELEDVVLSDGTVINNVCKDISNEYEIGSNCIVFYSKKAY